MGKVTLLMSSKTKIQTQDIWLQNSCSLPFHRILVVVFFFSSIYSFVWRKITDKNGILVWIGQYIHVPRGESSWETASKYQLLGENKVKVKWTGRTQWTLRAGLMPQLLSLNGQEILCWPTSQCWRHSQPLNLAPSWISFEQALILPLAHAEHIVDTRQ